MVAYVIGGLTDAVASERGSIPHATRVKKLADRVAHVRQNSGTLIGRARVALLCFAGAAENVHVHARDCTRFRDHIPLLGRSPRGPVIRVPFIGNSLRAALRAHGKDLARTTDTGAAFRILFIDNELQDDPLILVLLLVFRAAGVPTPATVADGIPDFVVSDFEVGTVWVTRWIFHVVTVEAS